MTFKDEVLSIAARVVENDAGWEFYPSLRGRSVFANKSVKFAEKIIDPGFTFTRGDSVLMDPLVAVRNDKTRRIYRKVYGETEYHTSWFHFQSVIRPYQKYYVYRTKFDLPDYPDVWQTTFRTFEQFPSMLLDVLKTGETFLSKYYDFSSEACFLGALPDLATAVPQSRARMMIQQCIGRIAIGDFGFVREFDRNRFIVHVEKFDKLLAALPSFENK